ncbi:MAG TPA: universal stress protein [Actinoplanes sp.]|nr:universal stress protein [Actinoplanes sp.]
MNARSFVLAAVDDDDAGAEVLSCAREQARRLGLPLRAAHVWTGRERRPGGSGPTEMSDSDRLLTAILYDNLPPDEAAAVERQILHDDDPARALAALGHDAALVVAAAGTLGETVKRLAGLADCPVAVVPATPRVVAGR